jgi:hypothetical protein
VLHYKTNRERDAKVRKNFKVILNEVENNSPYDIILIVFHFDDFNYGRHLLLMILQFQLTCWEK